MVQVPVHSMEGEVVDHIDVSDTVFGMPANPALVHQAVVRQLADARQGTVKTKSRGEVSGGGRKLFRQKGTGFARRGSRRAPLLRGGGVVFGPRPREYRQALPKKMRRLALRHSLSAKVADEDIIVVDRLAFDAPKTREMVRVLANLGVDASALVVIPEADANVYKSARNIPGIKTLPARMLNVADILSHRKMMITVAAVRVVEETWAPQDKRGTSVTG